MTDIRDDVAMALHEALGKWHEQGGWVDDFLAALAARGLTVVREGESLDAAWAEAEAAIGPHFRDLSLRQQYDGRYLAGSSVRRGLGGVSGETPDEALHNLIAVLRQPEGQ